jgi:hypothetical protein
MRLVNLKVLWAVVMSALVAACAPAAKSGGEGELAVDVSAIGSGMPIGVQEVLVTFAGPGVSRVVPAYSNNSVWSARIGRLPVGSYVVVGYGYASTGNNPLDAANPPAEFQSLPATVVVSSGQAASASIRLQQQVPPDTYTNAAPFINWVTASSYNVDAADAGVPGTVLSLTANVSDANDAISSYRWLSSAGGVFSNPSGDPNAKTAVVDTTWTPAPTAVPVTVTLTLEVVDAQSALSSLGIQVLVTPASAKGGPVTVVATINNWPDLLGFNATDGLVAPGGAIGLSAEAQDPDGDAVSFTWSSTCGGTIVRDAAGSTPILDVVTFTAPAAYVGPCTLGVLVADGQGGSTNGTLDVLVKAPVAYAPDFVDFFQVGGTDPLQPAALGSLIELSVQAAQQSGGGSAALPLAAYGWSSTFGGSFLAAPNALYPDYSTVQWTLPTTLPACAGAPGSVQAVTATVLATGAAANAGDPTPTSAMTFTVNVMCP